MKLTLKHKVIGLPLVAAVLPVLVMLVLTSVEKRAVTSRIEGQLDGLARENIEHLALAVFNTCEATSKMVEKYLDQLLLSDIKSASILHGKGTGALRDAIRDYLRCSSFVSSYGPGTQREGGEGITVFTIAGE